MRLPWQPLVELDWEDMREITQVCVAPAAVELPDVLDGSDLECVLVAAREVRDAAQAILLGAIEA